MEVSAAGLSRSATKETNRPTHATVHPYRVSRCRDNLQQPVAPRRQGPWVPFPFAHWGLWAPSLLCNTHAGSRVPLCVAVRIAFSLGCQHGSYESAPFFAWSVLGSPPSSTIHHCTGQVATDPQSPKGGSQRACPLGVPTPRLLGVSKEWR